MAELVILAVKVTVQPWCSTEQIQVYTLSTCQVCAYTSRMIEQFVKCGCSIKGYFCWSLKHQGQEGYASCLWWWCPQLRSWVQRYNMHNWYLFVGHPSWQPAQPASAPARRKISHSLWLWGHLLFKLWRKMLCSICVGIRRQEKAVTPCGHVSV